MFRIRFPRRAAVLVTVVAALSGLAGPSAARTRSSATTEAAAPHDTAAACPWLDQTLPVERRAQLALHAMSLAQKISLTAQQLPLDAHEGAAGYLAGIPSLCLPDLVFNDAGDGVGDGQINTTAFPAPIVQASSWDTQLAYAFGNALGAEAHAKGIDVQLAPGIETDRVPENGRNWEYMSEDPFLSGQAGAAEVRGMQAQHVIVTLKHYIANSQETNRGSTAPADSSDLSLRTLEELYAPQYDVAIHQGGAMGVMCSYNRINSVYACENPSTLKGILFHQFGFGGFVVSDWGATHSTVPSALAGLDIEMNVSPGTYFGAKLQQAIQAGQVPMRVLDDIVLRILRAEFSVGVANDPPAAQPAAYAANVSTPAHVALARQISEEGSVLLKNADHTLPLGPADRTVALIGTDAGPAGADLVYNAEGSGRVPEFGTDPNVVSPLTALTQRAAADGAGVLYADGSSIADAQAAARAASVAVVVVGNSESEGVDENSLTFDGSTCALTGQCVGPAVAPNALVSAVEAANPNTVVVLDTGEPTLLPWLSGAKALLEAFYPGQEDGNALASLLYGDVNPSGHLTETWPASQSAQPIASARQWPGVDRAGDNVGPHSSYSEGLLVGYRWFQARHVTPLFPFGYGLSYTSFAFSDLRVRPGRGLDRATATVTVTNTGQRAGADVAQLYVHDPAGAGEPPEQLKGFARVFLDPGQSQTVTIPLGPTSFAHWSDRQRTWVVSPGRYGVAVGDASDDLPLRAQLQERSARLSPSVY